MKRSRPGWFASATAAVLAAAAAPASAQIPRAADPAGQVARAVEQPRYQGDTIVYVVVQDPASDQTPQMYEQRR